MLNLPLDIRRRIFNIKTQQRKKDCELVYNRKQIIAELKYHLEAVGTSILHGNDVYPSNICDKGWRDIWEDAKYTLYIQRFRRWAMWLSKKRNVLTRKIYNLDRLECNDRFYDNYPTELLFKYMVNYEYVESWGCNNQDCFAEFYKKYRKDNNAKWVLKRTDKYDKLFGDLLNIGRQMLRDSDDSDDY